ncbi:hypothetical protein D3795_02135 [Pseudidiomarina andamanensis]|uniref:Uncharacterized protein n=1 Tax=Pseudidiomarina andamanensis TaxID=1940690 RepID=A0AA92IL92_9GAMM|nr:hypothetical protein D3795_02135 [Pseudidiomarina andamanensis]
MLICITSLLNSLLVIRYSLLVIRYSLFEKDKNQSKMVQKFTHRKALKPRYRVNEQTTLTNNQ